VFEKPRGEDHAEPPSGRGSCRRPHRRIASDRHVECGGAVCAARAGCDNAEDRQARQDLVKWMMSPALLSSEQMCVIAKKTN